MVKVERKRRPGGKLDFIPRVTERGVLGERRGRHSRGLEIETEAERDRVSAVIRAELRSDHDGGPTTTSGGNENVTVPLS